MPNNNTVVCPTVDYTITFDPAPINMGYAKLNKKTGEIVDWGVFSIKDSTNEGSCLKLMKKLDELDFNNCTIVYEQQPRCNSKTISICGQILMYYVLKKKQGYNIDKIVGYHAKNKINYYKGPPLPDKIMALKKGHYKTKKILVEHCRRILQLRKEDVKWIDFFEKNKKKDDMADAYVMSLSYMGIPLPSSGLSSSPIIKKQNEQKQNEQKQNEQKQNEQEQNEQEQNEQEQNTTKKESAKDEFIINPRTGRYVKRDGKLGQSIIKLQQLSQRSINSFAVAKKRI
jgi:hypothetical protein